MSYVSAQPHDHGTIDFGCRLYGGLIYRDDMPSTSTQSPFLVEHNLSRFLRRPGLYPHTVGFPVPLLETAHETSAGIRNRPPGNLRVDMPSARHRHRNLLAGAISKQHEDQLTLWTVNDLSDRKTLLQYRLSLPNGERCKATRFLRVEEASQAPTLKQALPTEAMELRYCDLSTEDELVFVRTKRSLVLNDVRLDTTTSVFQSSVRSFTQIPYLDGEVAVVDGDGKLFWGGIGTAMSRQKTDLDLLDVCATDCPRVLVAISEKEMRTLDLRVPRDPGELLYSHNYAKPQSADLRTLLSDDAYSYVGEREQFSHVSPVSIELETFLLTTTRKHLLLDRRMPGKPITSMGHAELDGSDYCITTPPFTDPETGGRAFSVYALSQTRRPCVAHWSVFHHPAEGVWSSLGAPYHLDTPKKISRFTECHRMTRIPEDVLPETTRAIHYQALPDNLGISHMRALLFRQFEDGSVWYENVLFDPSYCKTVTAGVGENGSKRRRLVSRSSAMSAKSESTVEFEFKRESLKYARRYLRDHGPSSRAYLEGVSEEFLQQPDMQVQIVSSMPVDLDGIDFHPPAVDYDPFLGIGVAQAEAPEMLDANVIEHEPDEDRILSKVVLNMWDKTKRLCEHRDAAAASAPAPIDEDTEDLRSETASVGSQKRLVRSALKLEHKPDLDGMQVDEPSDDYNFDVNLD